MLLHVMGYVFGGTLAHLQSSISTGRVAAARELATQTAAALAVVDGATVEAEAAGAVSAAKRAKVGETGRGGPMQEPAQHEQEQLSPKLALVSHALALAATPRYLNLLAPARPAWWVLRRGSICKQRWHVWRQSQPRGAASGCRRTATFCSDGIGLGSEWIGVESQAVGGGKGRKRVVRCKSAKGVHFT
jgi:hypothetical protein